MSSTGRFYVIQLIPEIAPDRIKLGYTQNPEQRLRSHQTTCPQARILKTWACHPQLEQRAIDFITQRHCQQLGTEVFSCDNFSALMQRAELFFEMVATGKIKPPSVPRVYTTPRKASPKEIAAFRQWREKVADVSEQAHAIRDAIEHKQKFYTPEEIASILNRKVDTVRRWMSPGYKGATKLRVSSKDRQRGKLRVSSDQVARIKFNMVWHVLIAEKKQEDRAS